MESEDSLSLKQSTSSGSVRNASGMSSNSIKDCFMDAPVVVLHNKSQVSSTTSHMCSDTSNQKAFPGNETDQLIEQ